MKNHPRFIRLKKPIILILFPILMMSCTKKEKIKVDLLMLNAKVYTVDDDFSIVEAFAVKDGKFVATGTTEKIKQNYSADRVVDAKGKTVVPGLFDAHAHFYGFGVQQNKVDLRGTKSFEEVVQRIVEFQEKNHLDYITGRGWDQNDWEVKEFPNNEVLDSLFPNTPVAVRRIDGHALLANQAALDLAGITPDTKVSGGKIEVKNGELTGILIDNAMSFVKETTPEPSREQKAIALKKAGEVCLSYGLTTVVDAGLDREVIELMDSLQKAGDLKIRLYAMASATPSNLDYYIKNGPIRTNRLHVCSFKVYTDGALGSRGAVLKEPYSDMHGHYGTMLIGIDEFKDLAERIYNSEFQMNTHAIGDSANAVVLRTYSDLLKKSDDRRWRVEHAQIIDEGDFKYFSKNIIPSVQPTHATSDMYWADERLGEERLKNAYPYDQLLEEAGVIALGTDFPVQKVNPFLTFYAAVARKDLKGYPEGGFLPDGALSRKETLKGMTIWAAYANFEEKHKGSIEPGKYADFVILDRNIMEVDISKVPDTEVLATYIAGEKVYEGKK